MDTPNAARLTCRSCGAALDRADAVCDLGAQPLANALLSTDTLDLPEVHRRLLVLVCQNCLLVQLPIAPEPETIFTDAYPFFSGLSVTWERHCKEFADAAAERFRLGPTSRVIEIGSNDGTALRRFRGLGVPALGVEPCEGVARHALMEGLATHVGWWGRETARRLRQTPGVPTGRGWQADLVIAMNVLAHVPDLDDFLGGVTTILAPAGTAVFEVPYVEDMVREGQWDQVYHEHLCYFSLTSLIEALGHGGLYVYDVERVPTHGGSLRVFAQGRSASSASLPSGAVRRLVAEERAAGLDGPARKVRAAAYAALGGAARRDRQRFRRELAAYADRRVVGYGASAKAAVTLNYLALGPDDIEFVCDATAAKQGRYLPGCRIPVRSPLALGDDRPDVVVNFCWNWRDESEANIRRSCPDAEILYVHEAVPALAAVA